MYVGTDLAAGGMKEHSNNREQELQARLKSLFMEAVASLDSNQRGTPVGPFERAKREAVAQEVAKRSIRIFGSHLEEELVSQQK